MSARYHVGRREIEVDLRRESDGWAIGDRRLAIEVDGVTVRVTETGQSRPARAVRDGRTWWIWLAGVHYRLQRPAAETAGGSAPDRFQGRPRSRTRSLRK